MEPASQFKYANVVLQAPAGMTDCLPLAVHRTADGARCISLWRATWRERLSILFFGKVWVDIFSGQTQPPIALTATRQYLKET